MMRCVAKSRHATGFRRHHKLRQSLLTLAEDVLPAKCNVVLLSCCRVPEGVRPGPSTKCASHAVPCCPCANPQRWHPADVMCSGLC